VSGSHHECNRPSDQGLLHPKKVGSLPVAGSEELKRTNEIKTAIPLLDAIDIEGKEITANEIKTAIPLLDAIDIEGKEITADALLTQRDIADYLVGKRHAHYHFTVKNNQPGLFQDIVPTSGRLFLSNGRP